MIDLFENYTGIFIFIVFVANILFWWVFSQSVKIKLMTQDAVIKALHSSLHETKDTFEEIADNIVENGQICDIVERIEDLERQHAVINEE